MRAIRSLRPATRRDRYNNVTEKAGSDRPEREELCSWCGHKLSRSERQRRQGRVCDRCYQKLTAAGISDEEIFREPPPKKS